MAEMEGVEKFVLKSELWRVLTQRILLPWVLRFADLPRDANVLEVGSGGGFNAEVYLERFPGWRLVASDFDPEMVAMCKKRLENYGDRVEVRQADATGLAIPDASLDIVVSVFVWHHVQDWPKATAECARVLKPGGRLLLVDLMGAAFPGPVARLFPPMSRYRFGDVKRALALAGLPRFRAKVRGGAIYRLVAEKDPGSARGNSGVGS